MGNSRSNLDVIEWVKGALDQPKIASGAAESGRPGRPGVRKLNLFTQIKSPVMAGQSHPLIDDQAGAGRAFSQSKQAQRYFEHAVDRIKDEKTKEEQVWGASSVWAADLDAAFDARTHLINGIANGDIAMVQKGLSQLANPHDLVAVLDPNRINKTDISYISVPVGVAALMRAQERLDAGDIGGKDGFEIARLLLKANPNQPGVSVGVGPDDVGFACSYVAQGTHEGVESFERRWFRIPPALYTALLREVPETALDGRVAYASEGVAYGEELPKDMEGSYADIGHDLEKEFLEHQVRIRRDGGGDGGERKRSVGLTRRP